MISAYITLLQRSFKDNLSAPQTEFIGFVSDAAQRMDQLITDLLRLAKVDANPRIEVVKLQGTVEEIKLNLEVLIKEKNAFIICPDLPEILADRTMIRQLFQNIIGNGIKYNESGKPVIVIKHSIRKNEFEISISDNGIGIPEHQRERAFQIFNRLPTSKEYPGSGIGLAICKKIVESMEGKIFIEDNPTGGTVFRMIFPLSILISR
jgi:signal transduction histidine kinase